MKDFAGNALVEGDIVAYLPPNYRHLIKGKVIGFTPKMVVIERAYTQEDLDKWYSYFPHRPYIPTLDRREYGYIARIQEYE